MEISHKYHENQFFLNSFLFVSVVFSLNEHVNTLLQCRDVDSSWDCYCLCKSLTNNICTLILLADIGPMAEISVWHQALVGVGPGFCIRVRSLCFVYVSNGVAALFVYLGSTDRVCAIDSSVLGVWTMRAPRCKTPIHATEHTLKLSKPVLALVGSWNQMTNHLSASSVKTQPP